MNISAAFIARPVATTLLTIGIALSGLLAFFWMPVAPLPNISFPTIQVMAQMAGASPQTMAQTVAEPLERHLGIISDVSEMTSQSGVGTTRITLQFGLDRDINGAARDVEAAIQAARADLPTTLRSNPSYNKFNPAEAPIMILALSSETLTPGQLYDSADTILEQQFSQINGVGDVELGGAALPAVRVDLQPGPLNQYGIGLEDVRAALAAANANSPKGYINNNGLRYQIYTNDQATVAAQYRDLVIAYRNGAAVRLSDIANVTNSVENVNNAGLFNGKPAVLVILHPSPGANVIQTVDQVNAMLPRLRAALPPSIKINVALDRSVSIRGALDDTERTLFIAILLVVAVVFVFLRSVRATLIPGIAVPVSILGTFGPMYLLGFNIDNLSLMALTIATGFVVDDAVVVVENTHRHLENGMEPYAAALRGSAEVSFTVLSMSVSLIAVFLPILLMPGLLGRLFREFAETLSITILISLVISLTMTPMLCARFLRHETASTKRPNRIIRGMEAGFDWLLDGYKTSLAWALRHTRLVGITFLLTIVFNIFLFVIVPKGFFPEQDNGLIIGTIQADQSISFALMKEKIIQLQTIVQRDPGISTVAGFTGGRATNNGFLFITLKPLAQRRHSSATQIVARLRKPLASIPGAPTFLVPSQDLQVGARQGNAEYQYTLTSDDSDTLYEWVPKIVAALQAQKHLLDVNSDLQQGGLETNVEINRPIASAYGITPEEIDNTLYDAYGQRSVSTIYNALNQYEVIMELAPQYLQTPDMLKQIYISTSGGTANGTSQTNFAAGTVVASTSSANAASNTASVAQDSATNQALNSIAASGKSSASSGASVSTNKETMIPLAAVASYAPGTTPISVNHQSGQLASTISFNLPAGTALSAASDDILSTMSNLDVPLSIRGHFAGAAAAFQSSMSTEPLLILAALAAVYIVLGILYESTVHPLTIISTIPSAGIGALLLLLLLNTPLTIIALIGVILLIGIVKKNAILMIDFALQLERSENLLPEEAIYKAAILRFRPILMTTFAAILGALPLAIALGQGASLRQPLGITIIGGLIVSQALTLYTTPVVYVFMDRLGNRMRGRPSDAPPRAGNIAEPVVMRLHKVISRYRAAGLLFAAALSGCMVGPDYHKPAAIVPTAYKEAPGWKQATPADAIPKGQWWTLYNDPDLNRLEPLVTVSNQTLAADYAAYNQAQAIVAEVQGGLYPTIGLTGSATRNGSGGSSSAFANGSGSSISVGTGPRTSGTFEGSVDWTPDIWGKIRRQVQGDIAAAQVTQADLANATLSAQASLASDYVNLRAADSNIALLQQTVAAYQRSLQITENQFNAGVAAPSDVLTARTQLEGTQAQLINAGVARAQYEHAIAVLIGHAPADLTIPPGTLMSEIPVVPTGVPSSLLERRPDIAAAERTMAEQNAQIGVAVAAFYPDISLSALGGYSGDPITGLFSVSNALWSLGSNASETLFEGGTRTATVNAAKFGYDESVATYRQTVLSAFQNIEDDLSNLRILAQQAVEEQAAVTDAQRAVQIALNEYEAGTQAYTTVVTAQATLLSDQENALTVQQDRLLASVSLIQDLGGGWQAPAS